MMALGWWRLSQRLRGGQAARIALAALLAEGVVVTAWPSAPPLSDAGPLQLFRAFCVVQWFAAAAAALWASAAADAAGSSPADAAVQGAAEAQLAWEDWFAYGKLGPLESALGLSWGGFMAGAGLTLLSLPLGAFAASASGTGAGQVLGAALLALLASGAASTWGTAIQAGASGGLRTVAAALVMAVLATVGYAAVGPFAPEGGPAMLSPAATLRFAAGLVALGAAGALAAAAAVRRHLLLTFGEGDEHNAGSGRPV